MRKIFIDLEMCPIPHQMEEVKSQCRMESIQIGAVILDEDNREVSSFREYVRPLYADVIPRHIEKLTGISYDMLLGALPFGEVLAKFTAWCGDPDYVIYSWSENDLLQILQETGLKGISDTKELSYMYHHWKDFQEEYCRLFPWDHVLSLKKAVSFCGLEYKGRAHDGLNDARATADIFRFIHDKASFNAFQEKVLSHLKPSSFTLADLFDLKSLSFGASQV